MDMEVMAMKASSEFGRLETVSASTRRKKVKKLKAIVGRKIVSASKRRQKVKKQKAWRKKNCYGFDFGDSDFQLITSHLHGGDYDLKLYCRLGLYCYNFQKGTNLKFLRWEKYSTDFNCDVDFYITLEAMDPASNSVVSFQTMFSLAGYTTADTYVIDTWMIYACRPRCSKPVYDYWDRDEEMDKFYTSPMPKWFSDKALASDNKKYYLLQESELHDDWLQLFMEIAFFSKSPSPRPVAPPPLEINKVVVETKEDYITEAREKLQAENAIFYISYKYRGVSSSGFAGDRKAIIRKTMDGKPGHMSLEVAYEKGEE